MQSKSVLRSVWHGFGWLANGVLAICALFNAVQSFGHAPHFALLYVAAFGWFSHEFRSEGDKFFDGL